jgi:hypothetical protein
MKETNMSNSGFPVLPLPDDDDSAGDDVTREVDDHEVRDDDVNDDLVDSAEADRLAAETPDDNS